MNADDHERLAGLVAAALAELDAGRPIDIDALCRERPEFAPDVRAALAMRGDLAALRRAAAAPAAPDVLLAARYRLLAPIGSGAAGTVWHAHDERLARDVAVKLLHRDLLAAPAAAQRFEREAVALAAHTHPHVVRIYDQGHAADGTVFLVTELLRGVSLHAVLQAAHAALPTGPSLPAFAAAGWLRALLPDATLEPTFLRQAVRWVAELGDGLAAAHAEGICHRDVKPSNAFVRSDGSAVLLDFGIAVRAGDAAITRTHAVLGTPCYMAPEQAAGRGEPTPSLDVYGLTATLYHLLTLRPPHSGDLQQVLLALRDDDPVPAAQLCRGLPRDLAAVLDRGLERDPGRRYRTMRDLVADLRAFLAHAPVVARPIGPATRTWRRLARRPARSLAVGAGAAAIALLAVAIPAWSSLGAHAAERERADRLARLPADLCIEGWPDMRPLVPADERRDVLLELDRLLELDGRDLGVRLLRAASYLDFGQLERARRDLDAIAAGGSDYARALAARYAQAARGAHDRGVVDVDGLPEPVTDVDCLLAGFHALRARDCERADALLSRAERYLPARDLRLLAICGLRKPDPERAIAEAGRLEGIYGRPTARTQHTLAVAHLQLGQYEQAKQCCERSLAERPNRHGPWTNLGFAHLRLGELDDALRCYRRAVELRPWLPNSLSGLSQTLRELGRCDEAREVAERIGDAGWRAFELGNLELVRALTALRDGDKPAEHAAAAAAAAQFASAAAAADSTNPKAGQVTASRMLAEALANDDSHRALGPLLFAMRGDPRNARQIANLAALLATAPLDEDARGRLRLWLFDLAVDLEPQNAEFRRLRTNLLDSLRQR